MIERRQNLLLWLCLCVLSAVTLLIYLGGSVAVGRGDVLMPLDDTYIHFQYARQIANGAPYDYNPGEAPTSGATSLLYPYLLAVGYAMGFDGLSLGLWAMGLGAVALLGSAWLVYQISRHYDVSFVIAASGSLIFILSGLPAWHFMSGMETGIITFLTLLTFYTFNMQRTHFFAIAAALLAVTRPEGSILALIAVAVYGLRQLTKERHRKHLPWLALPVLAVCLQPTLNLLITGSASATGSQAKSILSTVPFVWSDVIDRILDNFVRMWREFATGADFIPILLAPFALVGMGQLVRRHKFTVLLLTGWLLAGTAAIATLDTAFWHFKRYQVPLIVLFYPLAMLGISGLYQVIRSRTRVVAVAVAGLALLVLSGMSVQTWLEFRRLQIVNLENIYSQPLPMARWLATNTPEDAVVAVHDVGMMRYIGQRTTLDMVGLTTPGAADYWRNGPGAVAEFLVKHRPDYVAAYTTARGLNYLADTGIYGKELATYTANYDPADNVALGAPFQGIYRTDWSAYDPTMQQDGSLDYTAELTLVDQLNIADLDSERAHDYMWTDTINVPGFVSEVYQFDYTNFCTVLDGGRRIAGHEAFTLTTIPGDDLILITRLHPAEAAQLTLYINDVPVDTNPVPPIPGTWLELPFYVPGDAITSGQTRVRIETEGGYYRPYHHWAWQGDYAVPTADAPINATFQNSSFALTVADLPNTPTMQLAVDALFTVFKPPQGDYKFFVHVYDDINAPPIAQRDLYIGGLPPGAWLPGTIHEQITVDLDDIMPGTYSVAVGFYEKTTFERLAPATTTHDTVDNRLLIGEVTVDG